MAETSRPSPDHRLDIVQAEHSQQEGGAANRPWLQVWFRCAGMYQRVYRSADGTRYVAGCPRCGLQKKFVVGEGGTSQRFFEIDCR